MKPPSLRSALGAVAGVFLFLQLGLIMRNGCDVGKCVHYFTPLLLRRHTATSENHDGCDHSNCMITRVHGRRDRYQGCYERQGPSGKSFQLPWIRHIVQGPRLSTICLPHAISHVIESCRLQRAILIVTYTLFYIAAGPRKIYQIF